MNAFEISLLKTINVNFLPLRKCLVVYYRLARQPDRPTTARRLEAIAHYAEFLEEPNVLKIYRPAVKYLIGPSASLKFGVFALFFS